MLKEAGKSLERAAGIEPASSAWKAEVLPLHNARVLAHCVFHWFLVVNLALRTAEKMWAAENAGGSAKLVEAKEMEQDWTYSPDQPQLA